MSAPAERTVRVNGESCRVWEAGPTGPGPLSHRAGQGERLGVLPPLGGWARWTPFLAALATERRVVVPSLPGFPGGHGHERLDDLPDWIAATLDLIEASGLAGADLVGPSVGGALLAEAAAFSPGVARRVALIAPFGLYDEREPTADPWAQRPGDLPGLLCAHPERFLADTAPPAGTDAVEWQIETTRGIEAAARLLWPTGDLGLHKRLHRIAVPALLVWGSDDRVVPPSYAKRFAAGVRGPCEIRSVEGAGHRVDLDAPEALAELVLAFTAS